MEDFLRSHLIEPTLLRADKFDAFLADREMRLLGLIERATGHSITRVETSPEEGRDVPQNEEGFDLTLEVLSEEAA